jgi:biopolymer transport protein ExbD
MDLNSKNKLESGFSLASMTDIVFLLLIFFILTSTYIAPSALPVKLPTSVKAQSIQPKVHLTINAQLQYWLNDKPIQAGKLETALQEELFKLNETKIIVSMDKKLSVEELVKVLSIAQKLKAQVAIATNVEKQGENEQKEPAQ